MTLAGQQVSERSQVVLIGDRLDPKRTKLLFHVCSLWWQEDCFGLFGSL